MSLKDKYVWACGCGCANFRIYQSGAVECVSCDTVQEGQPKLTWPAPWLEKEVKQMALPLEKKDLTAHDAMRLALSKAFGRPEVECDEAAKTVIMLMVEFGYEIEPHLK